MSIRERLRSTPDLDQIVCYFMRTVLHIEKSGLLDLPLENTVERKGHPAQGQQQNNRSEHS